METEGVSFPEAVERLAEMAGVPLPAYSPEAEAREERRKTLHDIVELAAEFFERRLRRVTAPAAAAIWPTADLTPRPSSNSASAMRRSSDTRSRSIWALRKSRSRT